jgi:hypothetical protein
LLIQYSAKPTSYNKRINSLATLAGKNLHAHSTSLHKRACIFSRYAECYTLGGYLKFVLLFFSALIAGCSQGSCNKWEYASFSMTTYTIIENDEVKGVDTSALWGSVEGTAFFKNDKLMSKDSNKEISEFFKASSNHPVAILSALGRDSWEVYDYENYRSDPNSQHKEWELKRCY